MRRTRYRLLNAAIAALCAGYLVALALGGDPTVASAPYDESYFTD